MRHIGGVQNPLMSTSTAVSRIKKHATCNDMKRSPKRYTPLYSPPFLLFMSLPRLVFDRFPQPKSLHHIQHTVPHKVVCQFMATSLLPIWYLFHNNVIHPGGLQFGTLVFHSQTMQEG